MLPQTLWLWARNSPMPIDNVIIVASGEGERSRKLGLRSSCRDAIRVYSDQKHYVLLIYVHILTSPTASVYGFLRTISSCTDQSLIWNITDTKIKLR